MQTLNCQQMFHVFAFILLSLLFYSDVNNIFTTAAEEIRDFLFYEGSDFLLVTSSSLFVDKTLLIKDFFDNTNPGFGALVIVPHKFGVSSNINMIKRYFSLSVDDLGHEVDIYNTNNYKLFMKNRFNMCKYSEFFEEHFGKYPVINIDYLPLSAESCTNTSFITFLNAIVLKVFQPHNYIVKCKLSENDDNNNNMKSKINSYKSLFDYNIDFDEIFIKFALVNLCEILQMRFKKRVIVLVDNFDAFWDNKELQENIFAKELFIEMNCRLLRSACVERALLVSSAQRTSLTGHIFSGCNKVHEDPNRSWGDKGLWRHFGLSAVELDVLLGRTVPGRRARKRASASLLASAESALPKARTTTDAQQEHPSCVWDVMQYLQELRPSEYYDYVEYDLD